jgi:hypothetical protein
MICATHVQDNEGIVSPFAKLTSEIMCNRGNRARLSTASSNPANAKGIRRKSLASCFLI